MLKPEEVSQRMDRHFKKTSRDEFIEKVEKLCPEIKKEPSDGKASEPVLRTKGAETGNIVLFQRQAAALPLDAYLAYALTNLDQEQRDVIFKIADDVSRICAEEGITLYDPRKKTDPSHHSEVADSEVFRIDHERVLSSDLVIHLCHFPSTGAGEELAFAYDALVPIILISRSGTRVSRMVTGIPCFKLHISYEEPEDLGSELGDRLAEVRPILEQRKLAFSKYDANIIGDKIRLIREELRLTRDDIARNAPHVTAAMLKQIEESSDRVSNPSITQLREVATLLKTTVADLVEPDLGERVVAALQDWVSGRSAARFDGLTLKDRNKLLRRILLRVIDSLEQS
jgi:transcriptional regulator with XRE-family HTH domain